MALAISTPPPLSMVGRIGARNSALTLALWLVLSVVLGAFLAGRAVEARAAIWLPECGFKRLTTLPCPGCGGTRSLAALGRADLAAAFHFHPLLAAGALVVLAAPALVVLDARFCSGRSAARLGAFSRHRNFTRWLAVIVVINWIYLLAVIR